MSHGLVVLSVLGLALMGQMPGEAAGWPSNQWCRALGCGYASRWVRYRRSGWSGSQLAALGQYLAASWPPVLLRSLLSGGCGLRAAGGAGLAAPGAVGMWLWRGAGVGWPGLRRQAVWVWGAQGLWQVQRLVLVGYLGLALSQTHWGDLAPWGLGLGCVVSQSDEPQVSVARQADGSYEATLCGHFTLTVAGDHPFRLRLLVLFLSLLDVPGPPAAVDGRGMGARRLCGRCSWRSGLACPSRTSVAGSNIGRRPIGPTCSACTVPKS